MEKEPFAENVPAISVQVAPAAGRADTRAVPPSTSSGTTSDLQGAAALQVPVVVQ